LVDGIAAMMELCSYPSMAISRKFQSNISNLISENCIFGDLRGI
jgi:hypothetical protein